MQQIDLSKEHTPAAMISMSAYTVNFDETPPLPAAPGRVDNLTEVQQRVFKLATPVKEERERFSIVLSHYERQAKKDLEPRGKFKHFRRIGPPAWPRSFHYEFLDYGDKIGVEIHLESSAVQVLSDSVQTVYPRIKSLFPAQDVQWDTKWYHNSGRLRVLFEDDSPETVLAGAMASLINETYDMFNPIASNLRVVQ